MVHMIYGILRFISMCRLKYTKISSDGWEIVLGSQQTSMWAWLTIRKGKGTILSNSKNMKAGI